MVTESIGSKGGNVNIITLPTVSTTASFTEGLPSKSQKNHDLFLTP